MVAKLEDFLTVKNSYAQRLLKPSIQAGVLHQRRHIHVADAAASAGRNVHAIGVGSKMVAGKPSGDICIRIYVLQKLPKSLIAPHFHLPAMLDGLPTDIIESAPAVLLGKRIDSAKISGSAKAKSSGSIRRSGHIAQINANIQRSVAMNDDCSTYKLQSMQRPLFGGISAANSGVIAGTLGCFCRSTREEDNKDAKFILSNRHILGRIDSEPDDGTILQPSMGDGGTSDKWVARYARGAELDLSSDANNKVDAAIAEIRPDINVKFEVCGIGALGSPVTVATEEVVRKCGEATGLTKGVVRDISCHAYIPLPVDPPRLLCLIDQIRIEPIDGDAFINPGDSGSIVVGGTSNGVVGLICGGDPNTGWAIANPIKNVLESLQIELL
ncbi:MAG: hypothetical protein WCX91_02225 [Candidatus Omnitrophota bacterium]